MTSRDKTLRCLLTLIFCFSIGSLTATRLNADIVSFFVDPDSLPDSNMDGFVNGTDFSPVATDGTVFQLIPTDNLTGPDRFLLSDTEGLQFGGGGGSTLSFDFSVDRDISLESYTLGQGFFLSNPSFNITQGTTILSSTNTAVGQGDTHDFNGGPIDLIAGTTYSFEVQVTGAVVQSFLGSFTFTAVPEPSSFMITGLLSCGLVGFRRRSV